MRFGDVTSIKKEDRASREIELHGVLQKKNSKGFYQSRYFRTAGVTLSYYRDFDAYQKNPYSPSETYRFTDLASVVDARDRRITLNFIAAAFKLELRAATDAQALQWSSFLRAKINLYSVDEVGLNFKN
jgi:hypothetical protein